MFLSRVTDMSGSIHGKTNQTVFILCNNCEIVLFCFRNFSFASPGGGQQNIEFELVLGLFLSLHPVVDSKILDLNLF